MANEQQELTLTGMLLKFKEWAKYLRSKYITIIIAAIVGGIAGAVYAYTSKPKYTADITFVLSSNSQAGKLAGLAGQFGLDLGGGNDDVFTGDNIIELFKSQRIIKGALFRQIPGTSGTMLDLIIEKEDIKNRWGKNPYLKAAMPFPSSIKNLTPLQDSLVSVIHLSLLNDLTIGKKDKNLSFYSLSAATENETISYYLTKFIVDEAARFYIETKTKLARQNLDMLTHEADSLRNLLGNTITATAQASDETFNLNPAYQVQRSTTQQNQVKANILGAAYGEVVKDLEIAKITLQKETPLYQIIDDTFLPLLKTHPSKLKSAITASFLSIIFVCFYLLFRYTIKKVLTKSIF